MQIEDPGQFRDRRVGIGPAGPGKSAITNLLAPHALPMEVRLLLPREREVATIVYSIGSCTAAQVVHNLRRTPDRSTVRSMLNRLVDKGILKRTPGGRSFVYSPGLTLADSAVLALRRFANDYFAGSMSRAATSMHKIFEGSD